jgi:hypothetical protein
MLEYWPRLGNGRFVQYYLQFIFHESSYQSTLFSLDTDRAITNQQYHEPILTATENECTPYKHVLITNSFSNKNMAVVITCVVGWETITYIQLGPLKEASNN